MGDRELGCLAMDKVIWVALGLACALVVWAYFGGLIAIAVYVLGLFYGFLSCFVLVKE